MVAVAPESASGEIRMYGDYMYLAVNGKRVNEGHKDIILGGHYYPGTCQVIRCSSTGDELRREPEIGSGEPFELQLEYAVTSEGYVVMLSK